MRLAIYVDDVYRRDGDTLSAGLAFPMFAAGLADYLEEVTLLGRLDPAPGPSHHPLPPGIGFEPLPFYGRLIEPKAVAAAIAGTLRRFWRVLGRSDAIWLLGPHPVALLVIPLALARRRRVILGVRQNTIAYADHRHPASAPARIVLRTLEQTWRLLARRLPVVVVGSELAALYSASPRLLEVVVSFVSEADVAAAELAPEAGAQPMRVLSVGRLDAEKNPLLLADVLERVLAAGSDVRLVVCGDGELRPALERRLRDLGLSEHAELLGYVPVEAGLREVYRSCQAFLHISWTEGVPQVLLEAFAAGLPTVATDVGGVATVAADAALLVAPGDAAGAADALLRVIGDPALRQSLRARSRARVRALTREAQLRKLAAWMRELG